MPNKSTTAKTGRRIRVRRSKKIILSLLQEIGAARAGGSTLIKALQERSIPYNTYFKWVKKHGSVGTVAAIPAKKIGGVKKSTTLDVLQEMLENRRRRRGLEDAEKQIRNLDARFEELRTKLDTQSAG